MLRTTVQYQDCSSGGGQQRRLQNGLQDQGRGSHGCVAPIPNLVALSPGPPGQAVSPLVRQAKVAFVPGSGCKLSAEVWRHHMVWRVLLTRHDAAGLHQKRGTNGVRPLSCCADQISRNGIRFPFENASATKFAVGPAIRPQPFRTTLQPKLCVGTKTSSGVGAMRSGGRRASRQLHLGTCCRGCGGGSLL